MVDESDIENRIKQGINDISLFNNKHIIQRYNIPQSHIPEEPRYISCLKPTGFINSQYESRCYVNSNFKVIFFNIYFQIVDYEC